MIRRPPRSTRTDTLFPYTTLFRSAGEFDAALATGSEEAMQNIIETHPYLLQYAFRTTGHHGTWAYAKRWIRTNQVNGQRGLIPDFIAAMSNSLGYSWQIIELKRPEIGRAHV